MTFALSTNWNNTRLNDGAAIADEALALGFDALELGFRTTPEQLPGFRSRLDRIPVTSVHAYCPVPPGAPSGHPELHQLCSTDADERALAALYLRKTIACAAEFGARAVVFHAGYAHMTTFFGTLFTNARRLRAKRGQDVMARFLKAFEAIRPDLEREHVTLALENLPSVAGFPNYAEAEGLMRRLKGAPVALWFDTGHARVRENRGWADDGPHVAAAFADRICGMHINDVRGTDDSHREPGWGTVDFARLKFLAVRPDMLRVFEPHEPGVTFADLRNALAYLRQLWKDSENLKGKS